MGTESFRHGLRPCHLPFTREAAEWGCGVPLAGTSLLGMTSADIENIFGVEISMKIRATQAIMECLLEQEVDTVFGYPGGTILNVYDELYNYKNKIHHVLTAH